MLQLYFLLKALPYAFKRLENCWLKNLSFILPHSAPKSSMFFNLEGFLARVCEVKNENNLASDKKHTSPLPVLHAFRIISDNNGSLRFQQMNCPSHYWGCKCGK